jgi:hypothetical protein
MQRAISVGVISHVGFRVRLRQGVKSERCAVVM